MKLASRTTRITPSPTLQLSATVKALLAQGQRIFDFTAGEPSFDSPDEAKQAAINAIQAGFTKYTAVTGIDELKDAIIEKFQRDQGLPYSRSQIVVSCGAKHTLFNLALALFETGDEVIIPSPYWVSYPEQVLVADATPVFLPTPEAKNFAIDLSALKAIITERTKAIILNSPCNPTGSMYDRETLEGIAALAIQHDLLVISNEIYEKMIYDDRQHYSIATVNPDMVHHIDDCEWCFENLFHDRLAHRLCRRPRIHSQSHGKYSGPKYLKPNIHCTKGRGGGASGRVKFYRAHGQRIGRSATSHCGRL